MSAKSRFMATVYWPVTVLAFAAAMVMLLVYTPVEQTMGPVQKLFYIHLPMAINTFMACLIVCAASVGYLWQRRLLWDDLALSAAKVAVLSCTIVLGTGVLWAHKAWGVWWTWSPRLTFTLVLWLLYVVYLMVRLSIESRRRRAVVSAVYGLVAFADVPLVYLSTRMMPADVHPVNITLDPKMKLTLLVWFVPVTLLTFGLIVAWYRTGRRRTIAREQGAEMSDAALSAVSVDSAV